MAGAALNNAMLRAQQCAAPVRARQTIILVTASRPLPLTAAARRQRASCHPQQQRQQQRRQQQQQRRHAPSQLAAAGGYAASGAPEEPSKPAAAAPASLEAQLGKVAQQLTMLFPLWVVLAAVLGFQHPPVFAWFTDAWITAGLMLVMLAMGLTLTFAEIGSVFTKTPQLLLLGMVLQYTVLPSIGYAISRFWGLQSSLAIGVALVSCMPGGTASNIVAYIAKGDMPLSVMMTTASTLMAVVTTPILTSLLVGTLIAVDPKAMFLSTLQLVLLPVLAGAALNQYAPKVVQRIRVFTPVFATFLVVLIVGSMMGGNVEVVSQSGFQIVSAVLCLHGSGFGLGYFISKALKLSDKICRTNAIEVGMQSSALAAVLAKVHFPQDPMIIAPCVLSACTHATLGSLLAGYWNLTSKDEEQPAAA